MIKTRSRTNTLAQVKYPTGLTTHPNAAYLPTTGALLLSKLIQHLLRIPKCALLRNILTIPRAPVLATDESLPIPRPTEDPEIIPLDVGLPATICRRPCIKTLR